MKYQNIVDNQNLLPIEKDEKISAMFTVLREEESRYLVFVTKKGLIKRCNLSEFESIRKTGKIAIGLKEDDELISVFKTTGNQFITLASSNLITTHTKII